MHKKNISWKIGTFGILLAAVLYWVGVIICIIPTRTTQKIAAKSPRFSALFGFSWKLFTPPFTYNNRLYYIVRDVDQPLSTDTIEVMELLNIQKRNNAPFNQKENLLDHLVHSNTSRLVRTVWGTKLKPAPHLPNTMDSAYLAATLERAVKRRNYAIHLATLRNYGKIALREKGIPLTHKELKILITQQPITPFKERNNPGWVPQEVLVFDSPFKPIDP